MSRRRITAAEVAKGIIEDESDGELSDITEDCENCSDIEPDAADVIDPGATSDNSMNLDSNNDEESSGSSSSSDEQSISAGAATGYKSRTGRQWSAKASNKKGRASAKDVLRPPPGVKIHAENRESIAQTFHLFLSKNIVKHVTRCSNMKYEEYVKQCPNKKISLRFNGFQPFEEIEVEAGIGLLIF